MLSSLWLLALVACVVPDPPPPVPIPGGEAVDRPAKAKTKTKTKAKGAVPAPAPEAPLGVAGPATVEAQLATTEGDDPKTKVTLVLAFSDGSSKSLPLGQVPGKCTETPPEKLDASGKEILPAISLKCESTSSTLFAHVAQVEGRLMVIRSIPATDGPARLKVLHRFTLAPDVVLTKKT